MCIDNLILLFQQHRFNKGFFQFTCVCLACAFLVLVIGCDAGQSKSRFSESIASIDGKPITVDAFKAEMARRPGQFGTEEQKQALLDDMVRSEVLYAAACKAGYDRDTEILVQFKRLIANKFRNDSLKPRLDELSVSESEIELYYNKHQSDFVIPKKVRAAVILITVPARASEEKKSELLDRVKAARAEALEQAQEIPSFGAIAIKYSDDQATRYRGGDIGWIQEKNSRSRLGEEVMTALFSLTKVGEISPVITTTSGHYLVKLIEVRESSPRSLAKVKGWISHNILKDKKKQVVDDFYKNLRRQVSVTVNEELVASIKPQADKSSSKPMEPPALPRR